MQTQKKPAGARYFSRLQNFWKFNG
jgi:hypothetical protein